MARTKTVRWITLASFCLLITAFIFYRTGYFDSYLFNDGLQMQPTLNIAGVGDTDTLPPKTMLPSSKSAMVTPEMRQTMIKKRDSLRRIDSSIHLLTIQLEMLTSYKSAAIFQPGGKSDSIKKLIDSLREKRKKVQWGN